jgi:hypothetical protein
MRPVPDRTLAGFAHGIVGYRIDPALPRWDRYRYLYTLQCDDCAATVTVRGPAGIIDSGFYSHLHRPDDQARRCRTCRERLAATCGACAREGIL